MIDEQVVALLAQRQSFMPEIGRQKGRNELPLDQPERERQVLQKLTALSAEKNLDPDLVLQIFKSIFKNSKDIQKRFL
jgi:chorismate mutase